MIFGYFQTRLAKARQSNQTAVVQLLTEQLKSGKALTVAEGGADAASRPGGGIAATDAGPGAVAGLV